MGSNVMAFDIIKNILEIAVDFWWVLLPAVLFFFFIEYRLTHKAVEKREKIEWVMLELRVPRDNVRPPKAMEQVFSALHAVKGWIAIEIVATIQEFRFYFRVPTGARKLIESALLSQYPGAELIETEDYLKKLPEKLPDGTYDLWGTDMMLKKEDPYPIRTYLAFESPSATEEKEKGIDTIAPLLEAMSGIDGTETIILQILIRPTDKGNKWQENGKKIVAKIAGRKEESKPTLLDHAGIFAKNLIQAPAKQPEWPGKPEEKPQSVPNLTEGEKWIMKSIENKIAKLGFETNIRFLLIDKEGSLNKNHVLALTGAFRQLNTQDLNAFDADEETTTEPPEEWYVRAKDEKLKGRKEAIYGMCRARFYRGQKKLSSSPGKSFVLSTEELATVFHLPTIAVGAPMLRVIQSKKGGAPVEVSKS